MSFFPSVINRHSFFHPFRGLFSETMETQMDWKETPHAHIIEIDLPGLTREEVKLEVHEGRILHISTAEREEEPEEKDVKWHCRERAHGSFFRQFRLPENAKVDEIKASMRDGVLTVNVPIKDETKKKKTKHKSSVEISGDEGHAPKGLARFVCCKA